MCRLFLLFDLFLLFSFLFYLLQAPRARKEELGRGKVVVVVGECIFEVCRDLFVSGCLFPFPLDDVDVLLFDPPTYTTLDAP